MRAPIRLIAAADALRSLGLDRRAALWEARALRDAPDLPLFGPARRGGRARRHPARDAACEHVVADYQTLRLSLKAHPMRFLRASMARAGLCHRRRPGRLRNRAPLRMAGLVLIRQRPGSAKGVCFITLRMRPASPIW
jgi:error-prone DNA polymerase